MHHTNCKAVGITLSFTFRGVERHELLPNKQKRGSHIAHCAILETQKVWGERGTQTADMSVGRVIIILVKATPLTLNELHCGWKVYSGITVTASH